MKHVQHIDVCGLPKTLTDALAQKIKRDLNEHFSVSPIQGHHIGAPVIRVHTPNEHSYHAIVGLITKVRDDHNFMSQIQVDHISPARQCLA